jgi:hypothetical protein
VTQLRVLLYSLLLWQVHERTHRNDRPFTCNICHQKFYRKEPMQKHQWRQHGIVHFKSRPNNNNSCANSGSANNSTAGPQVLGIIGAEGVLYSSLIDRLKEEGGGGGGEVVTAEVGAALPSLLFESASSQIHFVEHEEAVDGDRDEILHRGIEEAIRHTGEALDHEMVSGQQVIFDSPAVDRQPATTEMAIDVISASEIHHEHVESFFIRQEPGEDYVSLDLREETVDTTEQELDHQEEEVVEEDEVVEENREEEETSEEIVQHRPLKVKQQLAQAYMREVKENREREERGNREREGRDSWASCRQQQQLLSGMDKSLSEFRFSSSGESNSSGSPGNSRPGSRVMLPPPAPSALQQLPPQPSAAEQRQQLSAVVVSKEETAEAVEVQCKSCGKLCHVTDPYSFCCGSCGVRFTSLPTHMIADPLQCIGCLEVFAHKPSLKAHQQNATATGRERPFRCCRCGFEFRQKAHLQKHQWRIHRKKMEPEAAAVTVVRQAEGALMQQQVAADRSSDLLVSTGAAAGVQGSAANVQRSTNTLAELAQRSIPENASVSMASQPALYAGGSSSTPLDLSPMKMYGTAGSITKWVEQVETARTPIVPDISILMKESATAKSPATVRKEAQPPADVSMPRFNELLSRQPLTAALSSLTTAVASSLAGVGQMEKGTSSSSSSVTLSRIEPAAWPPAPLRAPPQQQQQLFAVKSRPPMVVLEVSSSSRSRSSHQREENPMLNQAPCPLASSASTPEAVVLIPQRASKRPRTEVTLLPSPATTIADITMQPPPHRLPQQTLLDTGKLAAADLSSRGLAAAEGSASYSRLLHSGPLSLNTGAAFPLRLETAYSTVSPPLNLSSSSSSFSSSPQTTAFDYTLGGGKSHLLSGQLQRLKNQDQRSGI